MILFKILSYLISFALAFSSCSASPEVSKLQETLGFEVSAEQIEFYEDTHGGFHGDGEAIVIFVPDENQIEQITSTWQETPVEPDIAALIFQKTVSNGLDRLEYIPNSAGFWFYIDRGGSPGYSYNFSFALFDGEKVYYYELDT